MFDIDKDEIKMDSLLEQDSGAYGLDIVELVMTLEQEFGIILPDEIFLPIELQEVESDNEQASDEDEEDDVDFEEEDYQDDIDEDDIDDEDIEEEEDCDYSPEPYTLTIADYISFIHKSLNDIED